MRTREGTIYDHLPYLRRYARALTGSVAHGDHLVIGCARAASLAPTRFGLPGPSRAPLYALLHLLFDGDRAQSGRPVATDHPVERALRRLPECDRRLYLLVALEELAPAEAAAIVGIPAAEAAGRLTRARAALRDAFAARVLLVVDDADAGPDLADTIQAVGHRVCGRAANEREAMVLAATQRPTLAIVSLRRAGHGGASRMGRWLRTWFGLPVVFVTGMPVERAKWGIDRSAQILHEPCTPEAVQTAIGKVVFAGSGAGAGEMPGAPHGARAP